MSTLEMRKELHELIDREDISTIKTLYDVVKSFITMNEDDKGILESEMDIAAGRVYSHEQVISMIESWTKGK
jgi:predicted transcriptional regulator